MKVNTPNILTLLRVGLVPPFLIVYLLEPFANTHVNAWLALVIFVAAAVTDGLDGYYARRDKITTNFGNLMDPLADKLLICAVLVAFVSTGALPAWAAIVLISREFYANGLRMLALERGLVVAAGRGGKWKTGMQINLIVWLLLPWPFYYLAHPWVIMGFTVLTIIASIVSAVQYTLANREIIKSIQS
jgi:CDP-diacylglycerol--glycerol-3-phosphate 3-phosphatidyltransferase